MLTKSGFKRQRMADYLPIMEEQARELFGEDADLSDRTPLGKFLHLQAQQRAEDNEQLEMVYNARFIDTSEGATLEANVKRALLTRKRWIKATGEVTVQLSKGAKINTGDLFRTKYNVYFKALETVQAVEDGNYRIPVEALEYGAIGNIEPNDLCIIVNPQSGIHSVVNQDAFFNGQDEESDEELQDRYYASLGKVGARRVESIEANVLDEVAGVRAAIAIENDTNVEDAEGRPPHSVETVVLGGLDEEIAMAIFKKKGGGIRAYGSTVYTFTDNRGIVHEIGFTRATTVNVYVKVYIKKSNQFPISGENLVIAQLVKYVGGTYDGTLYHGVGMSTDVICTKAEARILSIDGVEDVRVEFSIDGVTYEAQNVPIAFPEVAETDESKIEVMPLV
ncbi:baseplate J/gp47 family protein [Lysinibacillus piscis]|uniref:Phage baseplate protein n=1 Tax=Lysinibacillus piscis TaxID=2518931 RepID=A0ABQ5NJL9_9BACI|nr:baseplate J/gp47 family protein [Lysinibacillus sp. KH24]GLC88266.1 phage baseplate protein [Lysinibacillus sp. KH24]